MFTPGLAAYKLAFQIAPLALTGGIASNITGGMLPIISLTQALNFTTGILSGGNIELDDCFAHFQPLPGATLIDNRIGMYPFANQAVAANAIIAQPLQISLLMIVPARDDSGAWEKLALMTALQMTLSSHNNQGGTYTVATPSYFYTNAIMTAMRDVTTAESKQSQFKWQLDFVQPLVSLQQLAQAQNAQMSKITNQTPSDGSASGYGVNTSDPSNLSGLSVIPAASNTAGTGIPPASQVTSPALGGVPPT